MKLTYIAAIAVAIAAPAMAGEGDIILTNTPEMAMGFDTHDECQSTFRQLRNDQRKSGDRGGAAYDSLSNKEYNLASRETTRCEQQDDGLYYVVYNPNGI